MFHPEQIFPLGQAGGDGHEDFVGPLVRPPGPALGELRVVVEDLEPNVPVALESFGGLAVRGFRHVELKRPGMRHVSVYTESNRVTGLDRHRLRATVASLKLVAPELVACYIVDRSVVVDAEIGRLADVAMKEGSAVYVSTVMLSRGERTSNPPQ